MDTADDFDAFYAATSRGLLSQLYGLTGDWAEAQDCLQEAYARAWQRWSTVSRADAPAAWVRVVAVRLARSKWRRAQHGLRLYRHQGLPEPVAGPSPETVALVTALRALPEPQRRALVLHHLGDLSVAEIAREEGAPEGTIKARLSRGRAALAELLRDDLEARQGLTTLTQSRSSRTCGTTSGRRRWLRQPQYASAAISGRSGHVS